MATLEADFKARIPADVVEQVSNDTPGETGPDDTRISYAATDVKADFKVYANVAYDEDNAQHVSAAIYGVFLKLLTYKLESDAIDKYHTWAEERLSGFLRMQDHNNRIVPKTTSNLTPATEGPGIVRPWFDAEVSFRDLIPDQYGDRWDIRQVLR